MSPAEILLSLSESPGLLYFAFDTVTAKFTYLNPPVSRFFNLPDSEITIATLLPLIHAEDRGYLESKIAKCLSGEAISNIECRFVREDQECWLRISANCRIEGEGKSFIGFAEDITNYKSQNQVLNHHNNKKNSILNILAHDLAGPIGTIRNLSTLLGRETGELKNARVADYIAMVSKISKNCIDLIRDFLDQEFLESAGVKLSKTRVDLVERITTATQEYMHMQKDLQINFFCKANRDRIYIEIDEDKFLQVINNLISNALKFTRDGGSITVNMEEQENAVVIAISDTGIGIPEKFHATLFDKFSEARRKGLKGEQSTGLGMSIIKTIVEWHQGKIWFKSEENKGTTFFIEMPKE